MSLAATDEPSLLLDDLPEALAGEVADRLDGLSLLRLACVSKLWRCVVCNDLRRWRRLCAGYKHHFWHVRSGEEVDWRLSWMARARLDAHKHDAILLEDDNLLRLVSPSDGTTLRSHKGGQQSRLAAALDPFARRLAFVSGATVRLNELATGRHLLLRTARPPIYLQFSACGDKLLLLEPRGEGLALRSLDLRQPANAAALDASILPQRADPALAVQELSVGAPLFFACSPTDHLVAVHLPAQAALSLLRLSDCRGPQPGPQPPPHRSSLPPSPTFQAPVFTPCGRFWLYASVFATQTPPRAGIALPQGMHRNRLERGTELRLVLEPLPGTQPAVSVSWLLSRAEAPSSLLFEVSPDGALLAFTCEAFAAQIVSLAPATSLASAASLLTVGGTVDGDALGPPVLQLPLARGRSLSSLMWSPVHPRCKLLLLLASEPAHVAGPAELLVWDSAAGVCRLERQATQLSLATQHSVLPFAQQMWRGCTWWAPDGRHVVTACEGGGGRAGAAVFVQQVVDERGEVRVAPERRLCDGELAQWSQR